MGKSMYVVKGGFLISMYVSTLGCLIQGGTLISFFRFFPNSRTLLRPSQA